LTISPIIINLIGQHWKQKKDYQEPMFMVNKYRSKALLYEGIVAYRKQDYEGSIKLFNQAIQTNPENEIAYLGRGSAYLMLGKAEASISDFDRATALNPKYARAYHQRGLAREMMGDVANAYRDFDKALETDPEFLSAYQSRDCILSADCRMDLVAKNNEMVEHLAEMSMKQFVKDSTAKFGV
jgi:tetratricopeptide (TPR) repeat protein